MIYLPQFGSRASTIVFKYLGQWLRTSRVLRAERPDAVFVMTPPVFAALPALWYAWRHRKSIVLDAHTAAFHHPRWRRWQWLQRALSRRAVTTIVHNDHLAEAVQAMGAHATTIPDVPVTYDSMEKLATKEGFVVAIVCSFNYDEPVAAMIDAARMLPDVTFLMTGNPRHMAPELARSLPSNVTLTGFLSVPAYGGLLAGADVVMALTTRDHTMSRAAYEAVYQGTPVIVSDWPVLRNAFPDGAVHVDNTPGQIAGAVAAVRADPQRFRDGALRLRDRKHEVWRRNKAALLSRLSVAGGPADTIGTRE
jgi:glycosyltransferase involved in cell wall biosynthesis